MDLCFLCELSPCFFHLLLCFRAGEWAFCIMLNSALSLERSKGQIMSLKFPHSPLGVALLKVISKAQIVLSIMTSRTAYSGRCFSSGGRNLQYSAQRSHQFHLAWPAESRLGLQSTAASSLWCLGQGPSCAHGHLFSLCRICSVVCFQSSNPVCPLFRSLYRNVSPLT